MSLRVVFRAAARHEFEEATTWYDQQHPGLGEQFLREIDEVVLRAATQPERYPIVFTDVRKAVARDASRIQSSFAREVNAWSF